MRLLAAVLALLLSVSPGLAAKIALTGDVTYRERIALPDGAVLRLQLVDLTIPTAPPRIDVAAPIGAGQVPLSFTLNVDDTLFAATSTYGMIAAITVEGVLLFRNFDPYPIDAAAASGQIHIVTALVQNDTASSSSMPSDQVPQLDLLNSIWTAVEIDGAAVLPRTHPTLSIAADFRAGGSAGCNSWFAEARIVDDTLRFGSLTSTQKGCTQSVNLQEDSFKRALAATVRWRVEENALTLFAADGRTLLRLQR
jgi:putative lipoprotein